MVCVGAGFPRVNEADPSLAAGMRVVLVPNASVPPGPDVAETADAVLERLVDLPVASLGVVA
jgi:hypothetical protein